MFKKAVLQGLSEKSGEADASVHWPPSDAENKAGDLFNILL